MEYSFGINSAVDILSGGVIEHLMLNPLIISCTVLFINAASVQFFSSHMLFDKFIRYLHKLRNVNSEWGGHICLSICFISGPTDRISMRFCVRNRH